MVTQTEQLLQVVREVYADAESRDEVIVPAHLSADTLKVLDPADQSPVLVAWAATLQVRQMARQLCRGEIKKKEREADRQFDLEDDEGTWSGHLQERYPAERAVEGEREEVYVPRDQLTDEEIDANVRRLEREGKSKLAHARALMAFKVSRLPVAA